jgi:hypothetical protein
MGRPGNSLGRPLPGLGAMDMNSSATTLPAAPTALDLKDSLDQAKRAYFQGAATYHELVAAAQAYRAAVIRLKTEQPTRYARLAVPALAKLLR